MAQVEKDLNKLQVEKDQSEADRQQREHRDSVRLEIVCRKILKNSILRWEEITYVHVRTCS
jgi:hypothetical protein